MDKSTLAKALIELNANLSEPADNLEELFRRRCEGIPDYIFCSHEEFLKSTPLLIGGTDASKDTYEFHYIRLNFYILELLNSVLSQSHTNVLSVQEAKDVKRALKNLILHGILRNLQPKLPHRVVFNEQTDFIYSYNLLRYSTIGLYRCLKYPDLKTLIVPHCLQGVLVGTLQIGHCPLKRPNTDNPSGFMTEDLYCKLLQDQKMFKEMLEDMNRIVHPSIFVKEIMVLFQSSAPLWFKKAISNTLTRILRSEKGVQRITTAMLSSSDDDTTKTWKISDVLTKIILGCRSLPDFQANICAQVLDLLHLVKMTDRDLLIFERLIVSCTRCLFAEDEELCERIFVARITTPLMKLAYKEHKFRDCDDITDDMEQTVRLLHGCFADNSANSACLPVRLMRNFLSVIFHLYHLTVKSSLHATNKELRDILVKYLRECTTGEVHQLLDGFLFEFTVKDVPDFRNDVIVEADERIIVRNSPYRVINSTADVMDVIYNLLDTEQKTILFGYLLKCLTDKDRYFLKPQNSTALLTDEDHATSTVIQRLLTTHKLLSQLSENKDVQKSLRSKPDDVIGYIKNVLTSDKSDSQLVFVVVMILDNLLTNAAPHAIFKYKALAEALSAISAKSEEAELRNLCDRILVTLNGEDIEDSEAEDDVSEFDRALQDVHDPLLPTRGHGLMVLAKLIEKKDKKAMERKQYLLNLLQLYLKDEDSFIYLNAIQGLAALADIFPDAILETLCEEYSDFSKKGDAALETRMKLGEVLVRIVKLLGEMAPKYKSLLLNTFLAGTKDDDHLLRASSLSNLGEVCRILNYKLGTIVTEVLVCVHAIITTDGAVEARRAAVTVIRQLFIGLGGEMMAFLKEEILPVYRTLKEIHHHDEDDVMRLQAQLALEELNENVKTFAFPNPQMHFEKKIVMLD